MKKIEKKVEKKVVAKLSKLEKIARVAKKGYGMAKSIATHPLAKTGIKYLTGIDLLSGFDVRDDNPIAPTTLRSNTYRLSVAPPWNGNAGLRVDGSQFMVGFNVTSGSSVVLATSYLSPDSIGGQMALDARNYDRFIFREVVIEYIPNVAYTGPATATNALSFALAYIDDPAVASYQTLTYTSIQSSRWSVVGNTYKRCFLPVAFGNNKSKEPYFSENDSTSDASYRQTLQGIFVCFLAANANATQTTIGNFVVHYVMDLYERSPDYGFTFSLNIEKSELLDTLKLLYKLFPDRLSKRDRNKLFALLSPTLHSNLNDLIDTKLLSLDWTHDENDEKENSSKKNNLSSVHIERKDDRRKA